MKILTIKYIICRADSSVNRENDYAHDENDDDDYDDENGDDDDGDDDDET